MEVIDDEACVGQQPWSADRFGVHRGRIDRDEQHRLPELDALLLEPVHDALAGASFPLPQQPLITVQIDEAGVVGVHSSPPLGVAVLDPAVLTPAGLIDAQHCRGFGCGQQRVGVLDERRVRGRPRHPVDISDLGDATGRITDRSPDRPP